VVKAKNQRQKHRKVFVGVSNNESKAVGTILADVMGEETVKQ